LLELTLELGGWLFKNAARLETIVLNSVLPFKKPLMLPEVSSTRFTLNLVSIFNLVSGLIFSLPLQPASEIKENTNKRMVRKVIQTSKCLIEMSAKIFDGMLELLRLKERVKREEL